MKKKVEQYYKDIYRKYKTGIATEHSYRGDLQNLLYSLVPSITVTNEPKRQECGAPDYILSKRNIPIGYIEAKDIGIDINKIEKTEQLKRYKDSLDNLILTDYLKFRFFRYGQELKTIAIASIEHNILKPLPDNFESFVNHIVDFCSFKGITITSTEKLAKMMAQKARIMKEIIYKAIMQDYEDNSLRDQLEAFRQILIHDLNEKTFADIYAQTITYGLFAARLHDTTPENFTRGEALFLIPSFNPFLRKLFTYITGPDLDDRVVWIVDDLIEIFRATNVQLLLNNFGKTTHRNDPFLHFYETFLGEYDSKLRKSRGVYYTPEPIVHFIVRAVDYILKIEFKLPQGLADTSKVEIELNTQNIDRRSKTGYRRKKVLRHKVQILDPATGTGTFLAEVIKQIYAKFEDQHGIWSSYVDQHLIPRINGFEILMASYAICHLKLEMLLRETGYIPKENQKRFKVFLTNSLEEAHPFTGTLFATWLSKESTESNYVKRDTPVMVVLGNPPYANFGQMNKGEWINNLLLCYKKNLNEKKINLDDDYIKFIRYGQYYIQRNNGGILAYISNNSFIDGITHRQMRKSLLDTFDKIYILDLHGSIKKKETTLDGDKDENVFDIQQGVSINIFIKTSGKIKSGEVYHFDLYGKRAEKYRFLCQENIDSINWSKITPNKPYYFFTQKDFSHEEEYSTFFSIGDLFNYYSNGIETQRDNITICFTKTELENNINFLLNNKKQDILSHFGINKEGRDWKIDTAKEDLLNGFKIIDISYRPFDIRKTVYTGKSKGFISYPRPKISKHIVDKDNLVLLLTKKNRSIDTSYFFITRYISDRHNLDSAGDSMSFFPLYLYPDSTNGHLWINNDRQSNLNIDIIENIIENLDLKFNVEKEPAQDTFAPIDLLDYIYAILYSPSYRKKYKEFLKINLPRIPYPKDKKIFWYLARLGKELRQTHLFESPIEKKYITSYPNDGHNIITRKIEKNDFEIINKEKGLGRLWINDQQYFNEVPIIAWNFYIGGYQPAQKWLKDRYGRELRFEDIQHYQKIIIALNETDILMKQIDNIVKDFI